MQASNVSESTESSVIAQSDKVMGVVNDYNTLNALLAALRPLDVGKVEFLIGPSGAEYLERREDSLKGLLDFFLGDQESEARKRYAIEIEKGRIVFGVPARSASKAEIVKAAQSVGAELILHFGTWVHESFPNTPA